MPPPPFVGPCPMRDRDCCIGSNFWKFYLTRTDFTLGELVSLVKVFRLFRLERIFLVFRVWTTFYLSAGPASLWCLVSLPMWWIFKNWIKFNGAMGVVEGWLWLLVQGQQLPWLLWPVHLIVITQTMFAELKGHPQCKAQQPIYCSGPLKVHQNH